MVSDDTGSNQASRMMMMKLFLSCGTERKMTPAMKEKVFLLAQSGDTSSEGSSSEDDGEAYTTEDVEWYEFNLWHADVNIIKKKPSLRNLRKKESLENYLFPTISSIANRRTTEEACQA